MAELTSHWLRDSSQTNDCFPFGCCWGNSSSGYAGAEERGTAKYKNIFPAGAPLPQSRADTWQSSGGKGAEMNGLHRPRKESSVPWIADRVHNPFHIHSVCYPWVCNASMYRREMFLFSRSTHRYVCVCVYREIRNRASPTLVEVGLIIL